MTNYDRLISKTPEELAEWIEQLESPKCPTEEMHEDCNKPFCDGCWLEWLRSDGEDVYCNFSGKE